MLTRTGLFYIIGILGSFLTEMVEWRGLRTEMTVFRTLIGSSSWNAFTSELCIHIAHILTYFTLLLKYHLLSQ